MPALRALIFDVDGTLVDSNDAHARSWVEGFISTVEVVTADGGKEIIYVRRSGPLALRDEFSLPADEAGDGSAPGDTGR